MVQFTETYPHIVDFGIDWLRLTWPKSSEELQTVGEVVYERLSELHDLGDLTRDKRFQQFQGIGSDRLTWATSESHVVLEGTSHEANELAKRLIKSGVNGKCTRIDTQITAQYDERGQERAQNIFNLINGDAVSAPERHVEKSALFKDNNGDTGVTAGARISPIYARFYHAQTGGHPEYDDGVWRYEIEWKRARAEQIWKAARISADSDILAASYTAGQFLALGIDEPYFHQALPCKPEQLKYVRSADKTLAWLENQVKPAIHNLMKAGRGKEVDRWLKDLDYSFSELEGVSGRLESRELIATLQSGAI